MKSSHRKLPFALASASVLAAVSLPAQTPVAAPPALRGSTFYCLPGLPEAPKQDDFPGTRIEVLDGPTLTLNRLKLHITTLAPGGSAHRTPSQHPHEEAILIKEGTVEFEFHGQKHLLRAGMLIWLAPNLVHSVRNAGPTPATYYVMGAWPDALDQIPANKEADSWAPADKLHTTIFDCDNLPSVPIPGGKGSRRLVVDSPTTTLDEFRCHITTLAVGAQTPDLVDLADEIIIIKAGFVEVNIKGISCQMGAGSLYFQAPSDIHSIKNIGPVPASYLVFKWVTPKTPKKSP